MATQPSRRSILQVAGTVGAAAATAGTLAGCGGSSAAPAQTTKAAGSALKAADIPVGGVGQVVVTQPTAGTFKAFSAVCTHEGCLVSKIESAKITCTCHGSVFDAATGAVVSGPAKGPLAAKTVTVSGDSLTLS